MVATDLTDDVRVKTMMLHHVGDGMFELSDVVGVVTDDSFAQAKEKVTAYFMSRRNEENEVFTLRQAKQRARKPLTNFTPDYNIWQRSANFKARPVILSRRLFRSV